MSKVLYHLPSEDYGYRLPVFKLDKLGDKNKVNIKSVDFNTNYYNISFNNNVLRYLRKVNLSMNTNVLTYHDNTNGLINPYITGNNKPYEEWHLCELRIPPGSYESIDKLISTLNKTLSDSVKELFNVKTSSHEAFSNVTISVDKIPETDAIVLKDAILGDANVITNIPMNNGFDSVMYLSDGSFVYTYTKPDGSTAVVNSVDSVVRVNTISSAALQGCTIRNPAFMNNSFKMYTEDNKNYINDTNLLRNDDNNNLLEQFTVISNEVLGGVTDTTNNINFDDIAFVVTKGTLKSFPNYIGLDSDANGYSFIPSKYNYKRMYNDSMQLDLNVDLTRNNVQRKQYCSVNNGVLTMIDYNFNRDVSDRTISSPIAYRGVIDTSKYDVRLYLDDNSFNNDTPYYYLTAEGRTTVEGDINDSSKDYITIHTDVLNNDISIVHGKSTGTITGYTIEELPQEVTLEANTSYTSSNSKTYTMNNTSGQTFNNVLTGGTYKFVVKSYYMCDANGNTDNNYDENGNIDYDKLFYSDGTTVLSYYKCDISDKKIMAVRGDYTLEECHTLYYEDDAIKDKYDILADGTYSDVNYTCIDATKMTVEDGIITSIIINKTKTQLNDATNELTVYYKTSNQAYVSLFEETPNDQEYTLVNNTITSTVITDATSNVIKPVNTSNVVMDQLYNTSVINSYYLPYGTNKELNSITLKNKAEGNNNTTGKLAFKQNIFSDIIDTNIQYEADINNFKPLSYKTGEEVIERNEYNKVTSAVQGSDYYVNINGEYAKPTSYETTSGSTNNPFDNKIKKYIRTDEYIKNDTGNYILINGRYVKTEPLYRREDTYVKDSINGTLLSVSQLTPSSITIDNTVYTLIDASDFYNTLKTYGTTTDGTTYTFNDIYFTVDIINQYDRRLTFVKYNPETDTEATSVYIYKLDVDSSNDEQLTNINNYIKLLPGVNTFLKTIQYDTTSTASTRQYLNDENKNYFQPITTVTVDPTGTYVKKYVYMKNNEGDSDRKRVFMYKPGEASFIDPTGEETIDLTRNVSGGNGLYNEIYELYTYDAAKGYEKIQDTRIRLTAVEVNYYNNYDFLIVQQESFPVYAYGSAYVICEGDIDAGLDGVLLTKNEGADSYTHDSKTFKLKQLGVIKVGVIEMFDEAKYITDDNVVLKRIVKGVSVDNLERYDREEYYKASEGQQYTHINSFIYDNAKSKYNRTIKFRNELSFTKSTSSTTMDYVLTTNDAYGNLDNLQMNTPYVETSGMINVKDSNEANIKDNINSIIVNNNTILTVDDSKLQDKSLSVDRDDNKGNLILTADGTYKYHNGKNYNLDVINSSDRNDAEQYEAGKYYLNEGSNTYTKTPQLYKYVDGGSIGVDGYHINDLTFTPSTYYTVDDATNEYTASVNYDISKVNYYKLENAYLPVNTTQNTIASSYVRRSDIVDTLVSKNVIPDGQYDEAYIDNNYVEYNGNKLTSSTLQTIVSNGINHMAKTDASQYNPTTVYDAVNGYMCIRSDTLKPKLYYNNANNNYKYNGNVYSSDDFNYDKHNTTLNMPLTFEALSNNTQLTFKSAGVTIGTVNYADAINDNTFGDFTITASGNGVTNNAENELSNVVVSGNSVTINIPINSSGYMYAVGEFAFSYQDELATDLTYTFSTVNGVCNVTSSDGTSFEVQTTDTINLEDATIKRIYPYTTYNMSYAIDVREGITVNCYKSSSTVVFVPSSLNTASNSITLTTSNITVGIADGTKYANISGTFVAITACEQCDALGYTTPRFIRLSLNNNYAKVVDSAHADEMNGLVTNNAKFSSNIVKHYINVGQKKAIINNGYTQQDLTQQLTTVLTSINNDANVVISNEVSLNGITYYNNLDGTYYNTTSDTFVTQPSANMFTIIDKTTNNRTLVTLNSAYVICDEVPITVGEYDIVINESFNGVINGITLYEYTADTNGSYIKFDNDHIHQVSLTHIIPSPITDGQYVYFEGVYNDIHEPLSPYYLHRITRSTPYPTITIQHYTTPDEFMYYDASVKQLKGYSTLTTIAATQAYDAINNAVVTYQDNNVYALVDDKYPITSTYTVTLTGYVEDVNGPLRACDRDIYFNIATKQFVIITSTATNANDILYTPYNAYKYNVRRSFDTNSSISAKYYDEQPILGLLNTSFTYKQDTSSNNYIYYNVSTDNSKYKRYNSTWYAIAYRYTPNVFGDYVKINADLSTISFNGVGEYPLPTYLNNKNDYPSGYISIASDDDKVVDNTIYQRYAGSTFAKYFDYYLLNDTVYDTARDNDGKYYTIDTLYRYSDTYIYVKVAGGKYYKVNVSNIINDDTPDDGWLFLNNIPLTTIQGQLMRQQINYIKDASGTYFQTSSNKYELLSKYNGYTRYMMNSIFTYSTEVTDATYYISCIINGVQQYVLNNIYTLTAVSITQNIYTDDTSVYILPLTIIGSSSVTGIEYTVNVNAMFDQYIIFNSNADITPPEGTVYRLIALSIGDKYMFKAFEPSDINIKGIAYHIQQFISPAYLTRDGIELEPTFESTLYDTSIADSYIEYNGEIIKCNKLFKSSEVSTSAPSNITFTNFNNSVISRQIFFDNTDDVVALDYTKAIKCTPNNNTIAQYGNYTFASPSNDSNYTNDKRSYIYAPFSGDHDNTQLKITEWLDMNFITAIENYKQNTLSDLNNYSERSGIKEDKLSVVNRITSAFEYNPYKDPYDNVQQKALVIMDNTNGTALVRSTVETGFKSTATIKVEQYVVTEHYSREWIEDSPGSGTGHYETILNNTSEDLVKTYNASTLDGTIINDFNTFTVEISNIDGKDDRTMYTTSTKNGGYNIIRGTTDVGKDVKTNNCYMLSSNPTSVTLDLSDVTSYSVEHDIYANASMTFTHEQSFTDPSKVFSFNGQLFDYNDDDSDEYNKVVKNTFKITTTFHNVSFAYYDKSSPLSTVNSDIIPGISYILYATIYGTYYPYEGSYYTISPSSSSLPVYTSKSIYRTMYTLYTNDVVACAYDTNNKVNNKELATIYLTCFVADSNTNNSMQLELNDDGLLMNNITTTKPVKFSDFNASSVNNTFITQIMFKVSTSDKVSTYYSEIDKSMLYYDQLCTTKYVYGHYLDINTNIYANNSGNYYIKYLLKYTDNTTYTLFTKLANNTYIQRHTPAAIGSDNTMYYLENGVYKDIMTAFIMIDPANNIITNTSNLEMLSDSNTVTYEKRYIKHVETDHLTSFINIDDTYGIYIPIDTVGVTDDMRSDNLIFIRDTVSNKFYKKSQLLTVKAYQDVVIANANKAINEQTFKQMLLANLDKGVEDPVNVTLDELSIDATVTSKTLLTNENRYYFIKYDAGNTVINTINADVMEYIYIPLKKYMRGSYDIMYDNFSDNDVATLDQNNDDMTQTIKYDELTLVLSDGNISDMNIYKANDVGYEQISTSLDETNFPTVNDITITADGCTFSYYVLYDVYVIKEINRSGPYVMIDNSFNNLIDSTLYGYYNWTNILIYPSTYAPITTFYMYIDEQSIRGNLYRFSKGIYSTNGHTYHIHDDNNDDITNTVLSLYHNLETFNNVSVVVDSGNVAGDGSITLGLLGTSYPNVYDEDGNRVTNEQLVLLLVTDNLTASLDDCTLEVKSVTNDSLLPKDVMLTLYNNESTTWDNASRNYTITSSNQSNGQHLNSITTTSYNLYIDSITKRIVLNHFIHSIQQHEDIKASNIDTSYSTNLLNIGQRTVNTKTYYRKYNDVTSNCVNVISYRSLYGIDTSAHEVKHNAIPSTIFNDITISTDLTDKVLLKNIEVYNNGYISNMPLVYKDEREIGVLFNVDDVYTYDEYYYLVNIVSGGESSSNIYTDINTAYTIDYTMLNDSKFLIDAKSYANPTQYYVLPALTTYDVDTDTFSRVLSTTNSADIPASSDQFKYALYEDTLNNYTISVNIALRGCKNSNLDDDLMELLKIDTTMLPQMDVWEHNLDIYPTGSFNILLNDHNFRIRRGYTPGIYDVNFYDDNEEDYTVCTTYVNDLPFILKTVKRVDTLNDETIPTFEEYPFISSNIILASVQNASITSAVIDSVNGNISAYINFSNVTTETITKNIVQSNTVLLFDNYFSDMVSDQFTNFITNSPSNDNSRTGLLFNFDCIPVSSDIKYSDRSNYYDIIKSADFENDYSTSYMPNIITFNQSKYGITNNSSKVSQYDKQVQSIDDYYYNFTVDKDIGVKLGYLFPKISLDDSAYVKHNNEPVYVIKGKYYSEQIYSGAVITQIPYKVNTTKVMNGKPVKQYQTVPIGTNILTSPFLSFWLKRNFYSERLCNLAIPTSIQLKVTQSNDVENVLNSTETYATNALSLGEYPINTTRDPPRADIAQTLNVNTTIDIPDNGSLYLYLTSPNQRYPIINSEAIATIEYI